MSQEETKARWRALPSRARWALAQWGVHSLEEIAERGLSADEILNCSGLGVVTLRAILEAMQAEGRALPAGHERYTGSPKPTLGQRVEALEQRLAALEGRER